MNPRFRSIFVLLLLAGIGVLLLSSAGREAVGWSATQRGSPGPTPLIEGFDSHRSVEMVEAMLRARGLRWKITVDSALAPGDPRPPFSVRTLEVAGYSYLGHTGELRLQFFNDRLMRTNFYADDPASFRRILEASIGCDLGEDGARIAPRTRVATGTDASSRAYVSWEDLQLGEEQSAWIARYS